MKRFLIFIVSVFLLVAANAQGGYVQPMTYPHYSFYYQASIGLPGARLTHNSAYLELGKDSGSRRSLLLARGKKDSVYTPTKGDLFYDLGYNEPVWHDGTSWRRFITSVVHGTNVTVTGTGTPADPYVINATSTSYSWYVANAAGTSQFTTNSGDPVRFEGTNAASVSFNAGLHKVTVNVSNNLNDYINGPGYITDGNTNWDNSYGFITNITGLISAGTNISITGSGTSGSPYVITNGITDDSQIGNGAGYITSSSFAVANTSAATQFSISTGNSFQFGVSGTAGISFDGTNKRIVFSAPTDNTSFSNGSGYITDGNTNWDNLYGFITSSTFHVANSSNTTQFDIATGNSLQFAASGTAGVSYDGVNKRVTISAPTDNTSFSNGAGYVSHDYYATAGSFNTTTGNITITSSGGNFSWNMDGRYLTSYSETDPVATAKTVNVSSGTAITVSGGSQTVGSNPAFTVNYSGALTSQSDVAITSVANNQLLKYNSGTGKWENWTSNFLTSYTETDPIATAKTVNVTSGTAMSVTGGSQTVGSNPSFTVNYAGALTNQSDVAISSVANNQLLKYNSTSGKWENWTSNFLTSFTESDPIALAKTVSISSGTAISITGSSQALSGNPSFTVAYNGALTNQSDVNISSASNGQLLQYQTSDNKWHNWTPNYLTSFTESDPIATAKTVTLHAGTNISITGGSQTIGSNPDFTINSTYSYTLPIASSSVLGGIKVGSGLSINATTGVLDVTYSYTETDPNSIHNQNSSAQTANYWISGNGTIGGALEVDGGIVLKSAADVVNSYFDAGYLSLYTGQSNVAFVNIYGYSNAKGSSVEFGTFGTVRASINAAGTFNIATLSGTGTRMVVAGSGGDLSTQAIPAEAHFGDVISVSGTTNRISVSSGTSNAVVDIASTYVGQTSITTLGTIGTGTWNATTIGVAYGGTGQTTYTDGQLLIGNSSGNTLTKATLTAGSNISITNGNGSITIANTYSGVTSVGFTIGTSGTDVGVSGSPVTSSGSFTLNIPTASASNRGALSSTDWSTFNSKIGGSGTSGQVAYFTGSSTIGNSNLYYYTTGGVSRFGVNIGSPSAVFQVETSSGDPFIRASRTGTPYFQVGNGGEIYSQNLDDAASTDRIAIVNNGTLSKAAIGQGLDLTSGTLSAKNQLSITKDGSGLKLVGDVSAPGNNYYYGTNGSGVKSYYALPAAGTTYTAQNGVHLSSSTIIKLGGALTENTVIGDSEGETHSMEIYGSAVTIGSISGTINIEATQELNLVSSIGVHISGALTLDTRYTPTSSGDGTYPLGTITVDDDYIYYRTSGGTWKKIAWQTF